LSIKPGGRHELLTAVVCQSYSPKCADGWRYHCAFPYKHGLHISNVYSDEVESVVGLDTNGEYLCSGCPDETRNRCFSRGITPATCA
jgi:hypothetical protein